MQVVENAFSLTSSDLVRAKDACLALLEDPEVPAQYRVAAARAITTMYNCCSQVATVRTVPQPERQSDHDPIDLLRSVKVA